MSFHPGFSDSEGPHPAPSSIRYSYLNKNIFGSLGLAKFIIKFSNLLESSLNLCELYNYPIILSLHLENSIMERCFLEELKQVIILCWCPFLNPNGLKLDLNECIQQICSYGILFLQLQVFCRKGCYSSSAGPL